MCDPNNWNDPRHVLAIIYDRLSPKPFWPIANNAFNAQIICKNKCGLIFSAVMTQMIPANMFIAYCSRCGQAYTDTDVNQARLKAEHCIGNQ